MFNTLEARVNRAVLSRLPNATVRIGGSDTDVPGIFRDPSSVAQLGIGAADSIPTVQIASGLVPDAPVDQVITVNGVSYRILDAAPDGTGLTQLALETAE